MSLREFKAKKAKFGFDAGSISLYNIIPHAKLLEGLQVFEDTRYNAESSGGYSGSADLKIYTDDEEVRAWLRNFNL